MSILFKQASVSDIHYLIVARFLFLTDLLGPATPEAENKLRESLTVYFNNHIPNNTYLAWLAFDNDELVGAGGLAVRENPGSFKIPNGKCGYLMNMYTKPTHRKKGICSTILKNLQNSAQEMGITYFELHATEEGEPVYIKDGFFKHKEPTYRKFVV